MARCSRIVGTYAWMLVLVVAVSAPRAGADEAAAKRSDKWLEVVAADEAKAVAEKAVTVDAPAAGWRKPIPLSFTVDYMVVSDYIWRGINFSEFYGGFREGREKLNHQLTVGTSYDTGRFGTFGVLFWLEWYAEQDRFNRMGGMHDNDHLQEVDYNVSWTYEIKPMHTSVEVGWIAYAFPQASGDGYCTNEWYFKLRFDDRVLFGTKKGVLNPYFYYGMDVDDGQGGQWMELGVEHAFALADLGCRNVMVLKDITVTPSWMMGIDHRLLHRYAVDVDGDPGPSTRLALLQWGLNVGYDLSGALKIPERYGSASVNGFLNFSQALRRDLLNDELFGGFNITYEW